MATQTSRVGIVDYQAGNIHSIRSAFEHIGATTQLVTTGSDLDGVTHILLPGVGAFGHCAEKLAASGLVPALKQAVFEQGKPMLGICVGMQLLADFGEEMGGHDGLGWIGGQVRGLVPAETFRVPHVGWNDVTFEEGFGSYAAGDSADFYFDHSFAFHQPAHGRVIGRCDHGVPFAAAVRRDNLVAAQFHPEKSQASGLRFLRGFLAMDGGMLKKRIVPKLLIKHRQLGPRLRPVLVTTRHYRDVRDVGDPVSQAKIYEATLADELIVLNIDGTPLAGDEMMLDLIERLATETFMPLAVGGGVRAVDDFGVLLERGADKVTINTKAVEEPGLIEAAATRYGAQCVVVSIDYRIDEAGLPIVHVDHASRPTGLHAVEFARQVFELGAGEIMLTNADRDGTGAGIDVDVLRQVTDSVPIPVIASGGCGLAAHFTEAFLDGRAEAVSAGTFFCFRDQNPMQARAHVRNAGIPIRSEV